MMKKLFSILLAVALLAGSFGCIAIRVVNKYANADRYSVGAFTYDAGKVQAIELDWAAGDIVLTHGTGTLSVSESGGETPGRRNDFRTKLDRKRELGILGKQ